MVKTNTVEGVKKTGDGIKKKASKSVKGGKKKAQNGGEVSAPPSDRQKIGDVESFSLESVVRTSTRLHSLQQTNPS
jgi:hypothetical protein